MNVLSDSIANPDVFERSISGDIESPLTSY